MPLPTRLVVKERGRSTEGDGMRITNNDAGNAEVKGVCLWLTRDEAQEPIDSLEQLLDAPPGRPNHHHVSSADYRREITVTLTED